MQQKDFLNVLGPLAALMEDDSVSEIMVNAPDQIYCQRGGQLQPAGFSLPAPEAIQAIIADVLALEGLQLGAGRTAAEIRLPDGARFVAVLPPTALCPTIVIRKLFKRPMTWDMLYEFKAVTPEAHALLQRAIAARVNVLVVGGTGSGKTTVLNMLTGDFPENERVITVEQTLELQPRCQHVVRLACENNSGLSFAELIDLASHMRPDRLVFGELHGPEAAQALDLISQGHDGAFATLHATSPEDALNRLENMCLMANLGLGLGEIRRLIANNIGLISYQERRPSGQRKITQIVEVAGLQDDRYLLQPLMRYDPASDQFEMTGARPAWEK